MKEYLGFFFWPFLYPYSRRAYALQGVTGEGHRQTKPWPLSDRVGRHGQIQSSHFQLRKFLFGPNKRIRTTLTLWLHYAENAQVQQNGSDAGRITGLGMSQHELFNLWTFYSFNCLPCSTIWRVCCSITKSINQVWGMSCIAPVKGARNSDGKQCMDCGSSDIAKRFRQIETHYSSYQCWYR